MRNAIFGRILISLAGGDDWWEKLSYKEQKEYLGQHPNADRKITKKPEDREQGDDKEHKEGEPVVDTTASLPTPLKEIPAAIARIGRKKVAEAKHAIKQAVLKSPKFHYEKFKAAISKIDQGGELDSDEKRAVKVASAAAAVVLVGALVAMAYFSPLGGAIYGLSHDYANELLDKRMSELEEERQNREEERQAKIEEDQERLEKQQAEHREEESASSSNDVELDRFIEGMYKHVSSFDPKEYAKYLIKKYGVKHG